MYSKLYYAIGDMVEFTYHDEPRLVRVEKVLEDGIVCKLLAGSHSSKTGYATFKYAKMYGPKTVLVAK